MAKRVLIADDSKTFRMLEATLLKMSRYEVIHAEDGIQTLKRVFQDKPDLVLLDVQMPEMDGVQVLSAMKKNAASKDIPVIVVSTIGGEKDQEYLRRGGASDVIAKPIDGPDLLRRIRTLIGG